ncbi:MAG: ABC transporter ATP-binding protein, partial [Acidobacteria bacterium]|nr:ABC transporter ATP-binding protein [Acidobacteriota bacterium]
RLSRSFGNVKAVHDLSLEVQRGEILGFLGPNGAGKTTTISMICGLILPEKGRIVFEGKELKGSGGLAHSRMGLCPQELVIWEGLTCLEQLEFMGSMYGIERKETRKRACELLEILGLEGKRRSLAKTLSGGMKRRLNLALALVHRPDLLILDEPQAGLDPQSRILVREYIRSLVPRMTVILTTHEMDEADRLADRIAVIDHGELLVCDSAANLKRRIGEGDVLEITFFEGEGNDLDPLRDLFSDGPDHFAVKKNAVHFVGEQVVAALPRILEKIKPAGLSVRDITIRKITLEDVFISLTGRGLRE